MRLLILCTCHEVASNLPQGCVPQNYAILLFAYLLSLSYLVALHCTLNLNSGIVTLMLDLRCDAIGRRAFTPRCHPVMVVHCSHSPNYIPESGFVCAASRRLE